MEKLFMANLPPNGLHEKDNDMFYILYYWK